jgi:hypothetical protein
MADRAPTRANARRARAGHASILAERSQQTKAQSFQSPQVVASAPHLLPASARKCGEREPTESAFARVRHTGGIFLHLSNSPQTTLRRPVVSLFGRWASPFPFSFSLQAREMERREAPGGLCDQAPGDFAISPPSAWRERSPPLRAGAGASRRSIRDADRQDHVHPARRRRLRFHAEIPTRSFRRIGSMFMICS